MRNLRRFSAVICVLFVFILGAVLTGLSIVYILGMNGQITLSNQAEAFLLRMTTDSQTKIGVLLVGLALLLVSIVTVYLSIAEKHAARRLKLDSPDGKLSVSVSAIEIYVNRLAHNVEGVKEIRSRVRRNRKGGWGLYARVSVWSDYSVPEVSQRLRIAIREGIYKAIGDREITPIDFLITKIDEQSSRVGHRRAVDEEFTAEKGF